MKHILKMIPNRVRRNYDGGAGIDWLHHKKETKDTNQLEEWIASTTLARNPGLPPVPNEGLASCIINGKKTYLKDFIANDPVFYFGQKYVDQKGTDPGFLFKVLDSSMRLHVQAHPTREFAQKYMNSPYGKLECYYILHVRDGVDPYIRLGFQHAPTKQEWKRIIETQDIDAMDHCFEKVPIHEGEIWHVPGGMPHAIGGGVLMLEIMEPSDLVIRCEFERHGIVVPPEARFMGKDLNFCLNIFDYNQYSVNQIIDKCRLTPQQLEKNKNYSLKKFIDKDITGSFRVKDLKITDGKANLKINSYSVGIVIAGDVMVKCGEETEHLVRGDTFLLAASSKSVDVITNDKFAEVTMVQSVI